jgi:LacI family transcriptional regulator
MAAVARAVNPYEPAHRPSLRDVAARAGTSTAVVSYVVNNGPRPVSPATRARVEAAIAELEYRPDSLARGLRARRTGTIALVVPNLANAFFAELAGAVEDAAFKAGQRLLLAGTRFTADREHAHLHALLDSRVDGVILVPADDPEPSLALLRRAGTPHVVLHRHLPGRAACVSGDDTGAGRLAAEHLLAHGHHVIGCLSGPAEVPAAHDRAGEDAAGPGALGSVTPVAERTAGFRTAVRDAGHPATDDLLATCDYIDPDASAYTQTRRLLKRRPDVTALCATTDEHALGAIRAAGDVGRRIGVDLALMSIDGTRHTARLSPPLTVVAVPFDELGRHAVSLLGQSPSSAGEHTCIRLPAKLHARASCGCRP